MDVTKTIIARGAKIAGLVEVATDLLVEGHVEGTIRCGGKVTIAAAGVAVAEIHAGHADVRGVVVGNVVATELVEVGPGARVVGDLRAPVIELDPNATVEGKVDRRLPQVEEQEGGSRTTMRLKGPVLRRPIKPPAVAADQPGAGAERTTSRPAATATATASSADAGPARERPAAPRPATRAKMVPRTRPEKP